MIDVTFDDVKKAHERIEPFISKTRVLNFKELDAILGFELFFKCENEQKAQAFKFRGVTNAVQSLSDELASKGVCTHSSGNHAAALALAAKDRGIKAIVVMPENAPEVKKENVRKSDAQIIEVQSTTKARIAGLEKVVAETGATFIHPYDNPSVIAGQGTAVKELIEELGYLDAVITPVGGGGLLSGTSIAAKALLSDVKIYAGEPAGADDAFRSMIFGKPLPMINPQTIADGLRTPLSQRTFSIIKSNISEILVVQDSSTLKAQELFKKVSGVLIEISSSVPLAALLKNKEKFKGKKVGMIISGGNV